MFLLQFEDDFLVVISVGVPRQIEADSRFAVAGVV